MNSEIILSPEELFFMGRLLQAKYIDYAYVAAMHDIEQKFALFESEVKAHLVTKGILIEDFGGNIEVNAEVITVLKPVFFGETETAVEICNIGEKNYIESYRYHFLDGRITNVVGTDGKFMIRQVNQSEISDKINSLIPQAYEVECKAVAGIDKDKITRLMAVKNIVVGGAAEVKNYIEADGVIYHENKGQIECVSREQFIAETFEVVKGV